MVSHRFCFTGLLIFHTQSYDCPDLHFIEISGHGASGHALSCNTVSGHAVSGHVTSVRTFFVMQSLIKNV